MILPSAALRAILLLLTLLLFLPAEPRRPR